MIFDANGNPVIGAGDFTTLTSIALGVALFLLVAVVLTAFPRSRL
jgi:hypothetical protein